MASRSPPSVPGAGPPRTLTRGNGLQPPGPLESVSVTRDEVRRGPRLTRSQHRSLVELTAYYLAERRGFASGHETEDWYVAENLVVSRWGIPVID